MGTFILYTVAGTLATFAILLHFSLLPYLLRMSAFANGVTMGALLGEWRSFAMTLAIAWIVWWSVSGLLSLLLLSLGKYTTVALFLLSLATVLGITLLIT